MYRDVKQMLRGGLHKAAQHFRHTPRLRAAAARVRVAASASKISLMEPTQADSDAVRSPQKTTSCCLSSRIDFKPCIDKRPDQPRPHGALMISRIARTQIAIIFGFVVRFAGRQGAQAHRRQQPFSYCLQHGLPAGGIAGSDAPAKWQKIDWDGSEGPPPMFAVHHVV